MLGYYLQLALRSFGRYKVLTTLMVVTIGIGIGAAMTTLTLYKVLSGDPIPEKSTRLFYPRLEPRTLGRDVSLDPEPMDQLTRFDAETLLREKRADRQVLMTGGGVSVTPQRKELAPFTASARNFACSASHSRAATFSSASATGRCAFGLSPLKTS